MFSRRKGFVHEQVASVMSNMGLIVENDDADPSNNRQFVIEGMDSVTGLVVEKKHDDKEVVAEDGDDKDNGDAVNESHKPETTDETDGNPDGGTTVKNTTSPSVNTDDTETKVDPKRFRVDKGDGPDAKKSKDKTKQDKTKVEEGTIEEAALSFYEGLDKPVTFVIFEAEDGKEEIEVFGLTNEDVAPFGGKPPIMPAVMKSQAKDGGSNKKGDTGILMLYSTNGMDERTKKILTGQNFRSCGWGTPPKGTGMKVC